MVKKLGFLGFCLVCSFALKAQSSIPLFQTIPDEEEKKILVGFISKEQIVSDTSFHWYKDNLKYFRPNPEVVEIVKEKAYDIQLVLFMGTWCHDSQQIVPKYFSTLEAAEFPFHRMIIIGTDRQKTVPTHLERPLNVVNIPTLLVMKDGIEVGRIVEYGESGLVDQELAAILKKL